MPRPIGTPTITRRDFARRTSGGIPAGSSWEHSADNWEDRTHHDGREEQKGAEQCIRRAVPAKRVGIDEKGHDHRVDLLVRGEDDAGEEECRTRGKDVAPLRTPTAERDRRNRAEGPYQDQQSEQVRRAALTATTLRASPPASNTPIATAVPTTLAMMVALASTDVGSNPMKTAMSASAIVPKKIVEAEHRHDCGELAAPTRWP